MPCTRDNFYGIVDSPRVSELVRNYREGQKDAKSQLPAFLFHATFEDDKRGDQWAKPSGLYMLDFDHIDVGQSWDAMLATIKEKGLSIEQLGIMLVHVTPSGKGLRVVARMKAGHPELTTIAQWQQWLAEAITPRPLREGTGAGLLDTCVKDFARLSFAVPHSEFLYLDDAIFSMPAEAVVENPCFAPEEHPFSDAAQTPDAAAQTRGESSASAAHSAARSAPGAATIPVTISDEDRMLTYSGIRLSEIAEAWLIAKGEPKQGERHTFYYQMAGYFRFICDNNARAMFAQLPTFGLSEEERWKICEHTAKVKKGVKIPYEFYKFLTDNGYKEEGRLGDEADEEQIEETDFFDLPTLPPLIHEFVEMAPPDFRVPVIFALFPILGTLCTRLRASYIDGEEHSTSGTTVIYAPQSAGKSFVRRLYRRLLGRLKRRDEQSKIRERVYKEALDIKKNAKELPKNPHVPYRIIPAVISVPQLLERQTDAGGLHQFTLLEELDTLTKSNKGGSWADKSDLYRVAYDNGEYGQDYKNASTFSGTVQLFYNLLICGTPKQVHRFFNDAENGLVSRVCFCEVKNQTYADIPIWRPFTQRQEEVIETVPQRLDALTYAEDDSINDIVSIDMSWLFDPLHQWLLKKLDEANERVSGAMAHFRKRAAVNAFRYGMICTQLFPQLRQQHKDLITDFVLWFAEQDLRNRLALFESEIEPEEPHTYVGPQHSLFELLGNSFTKEEVRLQAIRLGIKSQPAYIVHIWVKNHLIKKMGARYEKLRKR